MIGFPWEVAKFLWFTFFMLLDFTYYVLFGMMVVSLSPNREIAAILSFFLFVAWNLFSGFYIPRQVWMFLSCFFHFRVHLGVTRFANHLNILVEPFFFFVELDVICFPSYAFGLVWIWSVILDGILFFLPYVLLNHRYQFSLRYLFQKGWQMLKTKTMCSTKCTNCSAKISELVFCIGIWEVHPNIASCFFHVLVLYNWVDCINADDSNMVEMVLLGRSCFLDRLWFDGIPVGGPVWAYPCTWAIWSDSEGVCWGLHWSESRQLFPHCMPSSGHSCIIFICLRIRHQTFEFPKEMMRKTSSIKQVIVYFIDTMKLKYMKAIIHWCFWLTF